MKKSIRLGIIGIMAAVMCICLSACSGKTTSVKLEPYISVSFTGTDGDGTAVFDFDYAGFEYEIMSQWEDDEKSGEKLAELTEVELTLKLEQPTAEGLSNGDSVTAAMVYDEDKAKEAGYSFTDVSKTFTVEGLIEAIEIDPFDESIFGEGKTVSYTLEGISPQISFSFSNGTGYDDPLYNVSYHTDAVFKSFKNGDTITVTAELKNGAAQQGYVLARTEITIPVEGFDAYVTSAEQLTPEALKELGERALQERQNISHVKIYDGTNGTIRTELPENIHLGDTALLEVGKEDLWFFYSPVILIPVYETMYSPDYYDMATDTVIEKRWENIVSYFAFSDPVLHADNTFTYRTDYVEFYGAYPDEATAEELFLGDFREFYDQIEVPLQ